MKPKKKEHNILDLLPDNAWKQKIRDVEEAILAGFMLEPKLFERYYPMMKVEMFAVNAHQLIYLAIEDLHKSRIRIDLLTVVQKLRKEGNLEAAGGYVYLADLLNRLTGTAGIESHLFLLLEEKLRRDGCEISHRNYQRFMNGEDPLQVAADTIEEFKKATNFEHLKLGMSPVEIMKQMMAGNLDIPVKLPAMWEEVLGNVFLGDLVVIAARAKHGKTRICVDLGKWIARLNGHVLWFHLEMKEHQMAKRFLQNLRHEYPAPMAAETEFERLPISFLTGTTDLRRIEQSIIQAKAKYDVKAVIIDHMGLIDIPDNQTRYQGTTKVSNRLRQLSIDHNVLMVSINQINREGAKDSKLNKEENSVDIPKTYHIRDSGAIEQDATHLIICYNHSANEDNIAETFNYNGYNFPTQSTMILKRAAMRDEKLGFRAVHCNYSTGLVAPMQQDGIYFRYVPTQPTLPVANTFNHSGNNFDKPLNPADAPF